MTTKKSAKKTPAKHVEHVKHEEHGKDAVEGGQLAGGEEARHNQAAKDDKPNSKPKKTAPVKVRDLAAEFDQLVAFLKRHGIHYDTRDDKE